MNSVRTIENRKENDVLNMTITPTKSQKHERYVAHRSEQCRLQRERYAAEGPQLSVADRKFVGIERRPFINDSVDQHALDPLNCDYCNSTHISCERVGGTVKALKFTACCDKGHLTTVA